MSIYKVTACYYYDIEIEAESEVRAVAKAKEIIPYTPKLEEPEDYLVEKIVEEYDDEEE